VDDMVVVEVGNGSKMIYQPPRAVTMPQEYSKRPGPEAEFSELRNIIHDLYLQNSLQKRYYRSRLRKEPVGLHLKRTVSFNSRIKVHIIESVEIQASSAESETEQRPVPSETKTKRVPQTKNGQRKFPTAAERKHSDQESSEEEGFFSVDITDDETMTTTKHQVKSRTSHSKGKPENSTLAVDGFEV